jgi:hypothetical protein
MKINFNKASFRTLSLDEKIGQALLAGKTVIKVNWGYPRNPTKTGLTPLTSNQGRWSYNSEKAQAFLKFNPWSVQTLQKEGEGYVWGSNTKFEQTKDWYEPAGDVTGFVQVLAATFVHAFEIDISKAKPAEKMGLLEAVWNEVSLDFGPSLGFDELEAKKAEALEDRGAGLYRAAVVAFDLRWKLIDGEPTPQLRNGEVLDWDQPVFSLDQAGAMHVSMVDALETAQLFTLEGRKESKPSLGKLAKATAGKNRRRKDKRREAIEAWKAKQNPGPTPPPLPEEPAADEAVGEGLLSEEVKKLFEQPF